MKTCVSLIFALGVLSVQGAVTLGFSTSSNVSEGWANSSGNKNATMVWGIIVDVDGDGFDGFQAITTVPVDNGLLITSGASYDGGFNLTSTAPGQAPGGQLLSVGSAPTDDRLYIGTLAMPIVAGEARAAHIPNMTYGANMAAGDKYAVVWFDIGTVGALAPGGSKYGAWYKDGATSNTATILPADPGSYTDPFAGAPAGIWGADNTAGTKIASLTLVPEPSAVLLGLLGAGMLLRRRRH
jgi:hypothetical protein